MVLNKYERFSYRHLGPYVRKSAESNTHLGVTLRKAHIQMRPEVYLATSYMNMLIAFLSALALLIVGAILYMFGVPLLGAGMFILLIPLPLLLALTIYLVTFVMPDLRAAQRAKDIEAKLPYALSFISTMASAGVTPQGIFASLAKQPVYGEVSREAAMISRDLEVLGRDVITALTEAIDRSPSIKLQDLFQGAITTLSSGGDVKHYFLAKSEQYIYDNRQLQRRFLDNLSIMAESFVTVVVAAPLFLIVLLSVAITFGGNGEDLLTLGYILVLVLLPLAQAAFALSIRSMTPEA